MLHGGAGTATPRTGAGPRGRAAQELTGVLAPRGHGGFEYKSYRYRF